MITIKEVEPVNNTLRPYGIMGEFYQTFKGDVKHPLHSLPKKIEEEGETLPHSFYEANVTLISKPDWDNTHTHLLDARFLVKILLTAN